MSAVENKGALILTRRIGEVLVIGANNEVEIEFLGVRGNQVRVRVIADRSVPIDRLEVRARKDAGLPPPPPRGLR